MNERTQKMCVCVLPAGGAQQPSRTCKPKGAGEFKKLYPHPNQVELRQWQQVYIYHILHSTDTTESSATQGGYYQNVRLRCRLVLSVCVCV